METMLVRAGRFYLQLAGEPGSAQPHSIAVIDLASDTLLDADPGPPGTQGIALLATGPRFEMQRVPKAGGSRCPGWAAVVMGVLLAATATVRFRDRDPTGRPRD